MAVILAHMPSSTTAPRRRSVMRRRDWLRLVLVVVTTLGTVLGAALGAGGGAGSPTPCPPPAAGAR